MRKAADFLVNRSIRKSFVKLNWNDTTWLGILNDLAENRPWEDIQSFYCNLQKIFGGCVFRMIFIFSNDFYYSYTEYFAIIVKKRFPE